MYEHKTTPSLYTTATENEVTMTSIEAIEGRIDDRLCNLWGCEGSVAKNALDANTDCQTLIKKLQQAEATLAAIAKLQRYRADVVLVDDEHCPDMVKTDSDGYVLADDIEALIKEAVK